MNTDPHRPITTLGERLAEEVQRLVARRIPVPAWLRPFSVVMQHVTALPLPSGARFQRIEADIPSPFLSGALMEQLVLNNSWPQSVPSAPRTRIQGGTTTGIAPKSTRAHEDESRNIAARTRPTNAPFQGLPPATRVRARLHEGVGTGHEVGKGIARSGRVEALSQGLALPPRVQARLRETVGRGTEDIRIHEDEISDEVARSNRADAVTVGQHIFFRQDHFRPHETEGFALLAHEATHVLNALLPNAAWRRATATGIEDEEREALSREQEARATLPGQAPPGPRHLGGAGQASNPHAALPSSWRARTPSFSSDAVLPEPTGTRPRTVASSPALQPMRASVERNLNSGTRNPAEAPNFEDLRRALHRDLMNRLRTDFERGG